MVKLKEPVIICPYCGSKTVYVGKYKRYYCSKCRRYVPKFFKPTISPKKKAEKKKRTSICPNCRGITVYSKLYDAYYCKRCKKYLKAKKKTVKQKTNIHQNWFENLVNKIRQGFK